MATDAEACVVAFSTTDRESFKAVESWIAKVCDSLRAVKPTQQQVEAEISNVPMVLIQNKIDLIDKAVVTSEEATALADKVRVPIV
jgi:Ras-related protein Rab-23